jgi:cytochrome c-type biogenesis protein CcmH
MRRALAALLLLAALTAPPLLAPTPALAVRPDEMLSDPTLEARARAISKGLRCLVCQNQSIDDSDADLAHDLRVLVRERLKQGDSDEQVISFLTARYGDFVLLEPPFKPATWLLWFGPPAILLLGAASIILFLRRRRAELSPPPALDEAERRRLADLLKDR